MSLRSMFVRILPKRVTDPLRDDSAARAAIDHSRMVQAQARQFQLEAEVLQRGVDARRRQQQRGRQQQREGDG